jgi:hypothetical protein
MRSPHQPRFAVADAAESRISVLRGFGWLHRKRTGGKNHQPSPSRLPSRWGGALTRVGEYANVGAGKVVCGLTIGPDNSRHETAPAGTAIPDEGLTTEEVGAS